MTIKPEVNEQLPKYRSVMRVKKISNNVYYLMCWYTTFARLIGL